MKNLTNAFLFFIVLFTLSNCSKSSDTGCDLDPPSWLIGSWELEDEFSFTLYNVTIVKSNDILQESNHGSGNTLSQSLCNTYIVGSLEEVIKTSDVYSYKHTFENGGFKVINYST